MKTENIDKLPKWAQERLRVLEQSLKQAEDRLTEIYPPDGLRTKAPVSWSTGHDMQDRPLPQDACVLFNIADNDGWPCGVRVRFIDGQININADRSLKIRLGATNDFTLEAYR